MPEALKLVKLELGSNAVILHTRSYKEGGVFGIGSKPVVEVTASADVNIPARSRPRKEEQASPANQRFDRAAARQLLQRTYAQQPDESLYAVPAAEPAPVPKVEVGQLAGQMPEGTPSAQITEEIAQVRRMVRRMMDKQLADQPKRDLPDTLFDQYLALLEQEVAEELAEEVIHDVREKLSEDDLQDKQRVRDTVRSAIADIIPADGNIKTQGKGKDGRPRTIALIGPTGVGKTTTIAKLAATFKLKQKLNVSMITIDTYRIAAVDQLRTYANIIGLPVHVVLTPLEMKQAMAQCADADVVLIDTAGRSQRDSDKLDELKAFIEAANPHEVHLVLSSTCSQPVMEQAIERFSSIRTDRIILTKLDEAVSFGVVLNVIRRVNKQLSYITTGQDVPHHIEPWCSDRLAGLLVGETL